MNAGIKLEINHEIGCNHEPGYEVVLLLQVDVLRHHHSLLLTTSRLLRPDLSLVLHRLAPLGGVFIHRGKDVSYQDSRESQPHSWSCCGFSIGLTSQADKAAVRDAEGRMDSKHALLCCPAMPRMSIRRSAAQDLLHIGVEEVDERFRLLI